MVRKSVWIERTVKSEYDAKAEAEELLAKGYRVAIELVGVEDARVIYRKKGRRG